MAVLDIDHKHDAGLGGGDTLDLFMRTTGSFAWRPGGASIIKCADCGHPIAGSFGAHVCEGPDDGQSKC